MNKMNILVKEEAQSENLSISREQLKKELLRDKNFQVNDKFSSKKFKRILNINQLSENQYLDRLSSNLLKNHIFFPIDSNKKYNLNFSKKFALWENLKLDLKYTIVPYIEKSKIKVPLSENIQAHFEKNKEKYKLPKLRNFELLEFKSEDFFGFVNVTDEEIKNNYDENLDNYITPEKRDYLQVIFKNKINADKFYNEVKKTKNFISAAEKINYKLADIKLSGIIKKNLNDNLADIIFSTNKLSVLEPIKSNFGYHVIEIKNIEPKIVKSINQVRLEIANNIKSEKSLDVLYSKIDKINDLIFSGSNLNEIAKNSDLGPKRFIKKIDNFTQNGRFFKDKKFFNAKLDNDLTNKVWETSLNEISELIEINPSYFVLIRVNSESKERLLTFQEAIDIIKEELIISSQLNSTMEKSKMISREKSFESQLETIKSIGRFNQVNENNQFDQNVLNHFFDKEIGKINYLETKEGILVYYILKKYNDKLNINNTELVEKNFSSSLNNDIKNSFFDILENKHNLETNLNELNQFFETK